MPAAIEVENLSKRYRIQHIDEQTNYRTLRDELARLAALPFRRLRNGAAHPQSEEFWALREVGFRIEPGELVGLIGRNGAGKSTLLKILSRITKPTTGRMVLRGRVGSLLEVGTGFHPELSGRENVYLNGAILGMGRQEIRRKFDEIVAFAELEKFIDTPVKRYSSGMYLRLAFAVSAHLVTDIVLIDEALAVGDVNFQRKCRRKMHDIAQDGRTVLFVSHGMDDIKRLCHRAILLVEGRVRRDGSAGEVVDYYLNYMDQEDPSGASALEAKGPGPTWEPAASAPGNEVVRLLAARVLTEDGQPAAAVDVRKPVRIEMDYEVLTPGHVLVPNYHFHNDESFCLFVVHDCDPAWRGRPRPVGRYRSAVRVPGNFFNAGKLTVGVAVSTHQPVVVHFYVPEALAFTVQDSAEPDTARGDFHTGPMPGVIRPLLPCSTELIRPAAGVADLTVKGAC
jgi:lipopolysaccharide transport system ATP-binding protein